MRHEGANVRRIIRANRLLAEQGHPGNTLAALDEMVELRRDALRYRLLRTGRHWSVVDGVGDTLKADALDAAVDAQM